MTTRTILFDSPFLLGFDHTRALIDRAAKAAAESYPPYNVEQIGDAGVRITLAVAGFSPEELNVTLEGRQLTVAGKRDDAAKGEQAFLHRGIAARGFVRSFVLADGLRAEDFDGCSEAHARIIAPVRLIWGTKDPWFRIDAARRMVGQFGGPVELVELDGGRLFAHEEFPERFAAEVRTHFEGAFSALGPASA